MISIGVPSEKLAGVHVYILFSACGYSRRGVGGGGVADDVLAVVVVAAPVHAGECDKLRVQALRAPGVHTAPTGGGGGGGEGGDEGAGAGLPGDGGSPREPSAGETFSPGCRNIFCCL